MPDLTDRRVQIGAALAAAVLIAILVLMRPQPVPVDAAAVTRGPIAETVRDQGTTRVREAFVVSAPVSGRLERIALKRGDRVRAGETVVARVRPAAAEPLDARSRAQAAAAISASRANVAAARADLDRALAARTVADNQLARTQTLAARGIAAERALEMAQMDAQAARDAAEAAAAALRAARADLAAAQAVLTPAGAAGRGVVEVRSPTGGLVTRVFEESERTIGAGAPLLEIGDLGGLEAAVEFLSEDAVRIQQGMPAQIEDWGGPAPLPARVRRIEPQGFTKISALGVEEQRVIVLLQIEAPESAWASLGPGYRIWGRVTLRAEPDAVIAPLGALVRAEGRWAVYRIERGRARLAPVDVGAITDSAVEVRSGLAEGDTVVVFPSDQVSDGVRVRTRLSLSQEQDVGEPVD